MVYVIQVCWQLASRIRTERPDPNSSRETISKCGVLTSSSFVKYSACGKESSWMTTKWNPVSRYNVSLLFYLTGKIRLIIGHEVKECDKVIALNFNLGARWGGCSTSRPSRFTPEKEPIPILYEAGWTPGSFWMGGEFTPTGVRTPNRPVRSGSLCRLH